MKWVVLISVILMTRILLGLLTAKLVGETTFKQKIFDRIHKNIVYIIQ